MKKMRAKKKLATSTILTFDDLFKSPQSFGKTLKKC